MIVEVFDFVVFVSVVVGRFSVVTGLVMAVFVLVLVVCLLCVVGSGSGHVLCFEMCFVVEAEVGVTVVLPATG